MSQLMREDIKQSIQLRINSNKEGYQQLSSKLRSYDYMKYLEMLIEIAQYTSHAQKQQNSLLSHNNRGQHKMIISNRLITIAQIINSQIITILLNKNNEQGQYQQQQTTFNNIKHIYTKIFTNYQLCSSQFLQQLRQSLQTFIQHLTINQLQSLIQTYQPYIDQSTTIQYLCITSLFNSTQYIELIMKQGFKTIQRFNNKFFITLDSIIKYLDQIQTQQQAVDIVLKEVQNWIMNIKLIMNLVKRVSDNQYCLNDIMLQLNNHNIFNKIIKQILKIDQTIQIKPPIEQQQSCQLIGLGILVSCKYSQFNQRLNLLKKHALSLILLILSKFQEENKCIFQDILDIINQTFYQQAIGDLCIISRQYLYFESTKYLNQGQYTLIKKLYRFLFFSLRISSLKSRLFSAINETIGWQVFLFFVCVVNMRQFQSQNDQIDINQNVNEHQSYEDSKNNIENKQKQIFVTDLLQQILSHKEQFRQPLISLSSQIASNLIEQDDKETIRKKLIKFGLQSEPMLHKFLQNHIYINFWLHLINLLTAQMSQATNIELIKLLQKSSCLLRNFQTQRLKDLLTFYLRVSHALIQSQKGCEIMQKIIDYILQLGQQDVEQEKRKQYMFMFLTRLLRISDKLVYNNNQMNRLFDLCYRKIQRQFYERRNKDNLQQEDKSIRIYINLVSRVMQRIQLVNEKLNNNVEFQRSEQCLISLIRILTQNSSKISKNQLLSVCEMVKYLLRNISHNLLSGQNRYCENRFKQLIESIHNLLMNIEQTNTEYIQCIKLLFLMSNTSNSNKSQQLSTHALSIIINKFNKNNQSTQISPSSNQLKSIIQLLIIFYVRSNQKSSLFQQLLLQASILVIKQCKNNTKSQKWMKEQRRLSYQSPRKLLIKNKVLLQIQAFKLTILMLSHHCNNNNINNNNNNTKYLNNHNNYSNNNQSIKNNDYRYRQFIDQLHQSISLPKQLRSFDKLLTFDDISMICYAVDNYVQFICFQDKCKFLLSIAILLTQQHNNIKQNIIINTYSYYSNILNHQLNPFLIIRHHLVDLLGQIQNIFKSQNNNNRQQIQIDNRQQIKANNRQQLQKYHYGIRVLLEETQSLTIVNGEQRKIYKHKPINKEIYHSNQYQQTQQIII